jgi:hypothetical protein
MRDIYGEIISVKCQAVNPAKKKKKNFRHGAYPFRTESSIYISQISYKSHKLTNTIYINNLLPHFPAPAPAPASPTIPWNLSLYRKGEDLGTH